MAVRRGRVVAATIVVLASIVGTTTAAVVVAHRQLDAELAGYAANAAASVRQDVQLNLQRDVSAAIGLARSLGEVTDVDGPTWTTAIGEVAAAGAFGELSAASLLVVTSAEDLEATVARLPASVQAGLDLRLSDAPMHAVGTVTWPRAANAPILGYDVLSNDVAAPAARAAIRWHRVQATPPVQLVQGPDAQDATIVYVPVAAPDAGAGDDAGGAAGLISLVFRAERLLADTVELLPAGTVVRFADRSGGQDASTLLGAEEDREVAGARAVELLVELGRSYRIEVEVPRSTLGAVQRRTPVLIGALGSVLLVSTVLLLSTWRRTADIADARVRRRTSDLLAATSELERANQELRDLDRFKDRMLGTVSHDLRSPLTVIRGGAEMLLDRPELTETQRRDLLARLLRQTERLRGLVDELLVSAQVRAGALRADPARIDLRPLITTITGDLGVGELHDGPPVPAVVADPVHVERILHNLLMNADLHGRPPVEVALRHDDGDTVEVSVRDHGDGVPDDLRDAIFDEGARAVDTGPGHGLGLAIATELARANGGTLTYRDASAPGACFVLSLPVAAADER